MHMNKAQEDHLKFIKDEFSALVDPKYRAGQKEHGGNLFDVSAKELVDMALEEAVDQIVYLLTLRENLEYLEEK